MSDSFQNEVPAGRVNIKLDLHTGGSRKKIELPLKLLTMGNYSNKQGKKPLGEREKIAVTKENFNAVLAELNPKISLSVKNTLTDDADSLTRVEMDFAHIKDFEPEQVAKKIPQMRSLLAMRNLLRDLKSNLLDNTTFRIELERILKDQQLSDELRAEFAAMSPTVPE